MSPKTPRFDRYQKLFYRLYEAILLLHNLNKTQGPHLLRNHDASDIVGIRRRFLNNLAFICDHKKGGGTITAVAIEETSECFKFWIAMNHEPSQDTDVVFLVRAVLTLLKKAAKLPQGETDKQEATILRLIIKHASQKLQQKVQFLSTSAKKCIFLLRDSAGSTEMELATWLEQFKYKSDVQFQDLCVLAFEQLHSPQVYQLERLSVSEATASGPFMENKPFKEVRHHLGRLAKYIRVVKQLMDDSRHLQDLFEPFLVGMIPVPEAVPLPLYDGHINLESILGRILHQDDPRRQNMGDMISTLERITPAPGVEANIIKTFQTQDISPQVHAEVQLLEFFSPIGDDIGRKFASGDRFIGCSKLSCFCCKLYFQHHPSRPVQRESHDNHWPQWSPPRLPNGIKNAGYPAQRTLMHKVIKEIGEVALDRINGLVQASVRHADSVTGITRSVVEMDVQDLNAQEAGRVIQPDTTTRSLNQVTQGKQAVMIHSMWLAPARQHFHPRAGSTDSGAQV